MVDLKTQAVVYSVRNLSGPNMDRGRLVWTLMGLGWYIGLSIVLPMLGGWMLDRKEDTIPLFTLLGLGLGLVLAFTGVYRVLQSIEKEQSKKGEKD